MKIINPVNNFSGNRFLHVLKCGFLSPEFRLCVMSMAVMYMIFFFVRLFDFALVYEMLDELSDFTFLTMVFGITFGASFFAASLSDKGNRISHIMLPATNMEKFLARLIIVVCGTIVASYIIYLVLYLLLGIILWISGDIPADAKFNPFAYFNFRFYGVTRINKFLLPLFVCALFGFSLYLLGGILWKKKSWIITSIILMPCFILGVTGGYLTVFKNINVNIWCNGDDTAGLIFHIVITAAMAVFCFWLSYFLFKRMQVVRPGLKSYLSGLRKRL